MGLENDSVEILTPRWTRLRMTPLRSSSYEGQGGGVHISKIHKREIFIAQAVRKELFGLFVHRLALFAHTYL